MYRIKNFFLYIKRFFYYGRIGASRTRDYDANGIHELIHAHMVRVKRYMNSRDTHLVWNDKPDTRGMRLLAEFTELSRRMAEDGMQTHYYWGIIYNESLESGECYFDKMNNRSEEESRRTKVAFKKDSMVTKCQLERYYYLLEKNVDGFWD